MHAGTPRPFAIGVLGLPRGCPESHRRECRLDVALRGYKLGYFMVEVVEISNPMRAGDRYAYRLVEDLATRTDAAAFVVQGSIDLVELHRVAEAVRATIHLPIPR